MRRIASLLITFSVLATLSCTKPGGSTSGGKKKLTIAVIPKGTTHEFWKSIRRQYQSCRTFRARNEVRVIWKDHC